MRKHTKSCSSNSDRRYSGSLLVGKDNELLTRLSLVRFQVPEPPPTFTRTLKTRAGKSLSAAETGP